MPRTKRITLAERLRALRESAGISQAEAARRAKLSLPSVENLEGGRMTNPRLGTLRALAEVYAVPITQLLSDG